MRVTAAVCPMAERVLHVIPALAPRYGGPSVATLGMCRALRADGASALIATTDADGASRLPVETNSLSERDGVPVMWFRRQFSESFKWSRPLARWLAAHVRDFDLVHVHAVFSHSTIAAGAACRAADVPYVVRPLGTLDPWSLGHHRARKRVLLACGLRRTLAGATRMHYTASDEQRLAKAELPWLPEGAVIPLGLDDTCFLTADNRRARERLIVSLARLHPKKGVDLLIAAFHRVAPAARLGWRLVIAGDGEAAYVERLRRLAGEGDAADAIDFVGWLDSERRASVLARARLLALPSHQENFGIAVAEAMASGVAVMVTPFVNLASVIETGRAGWIVESETEWAAALGHVLPDVDA